MRLLPVALLLVLPFVTQCGSEHINPSQAALQGTDWKETMALLEAKTSSCSPLPGVGMFSQNGGGTSDIPMCQLDGAVFWKADFDIDCDGGTSANCHADPYYQASTSGVDSKGKYLNASTLPYVVLPLDGDTFKASNFGLSLGSVVAVIYKDVMAYAVIGDRGPRGAIGEGSEYLAEILGINTDARSGGVEGKVVTYIAFTGAEGKSSPLEDHEAARVVGRRQADRLVGQ